MMLCDHTYPIPEYGGCLQTSPAIVAKLARILNLASCKESHTDKAATKLVNAPGSSKLFDHSSLYRTKADGSCSGTSGIHICHKLAS